MDGRWKSTFFRWVLTLHRNPCLIFDRCCARVLAYWRLYVLNFCALVSRTWYRCLTDVMDSGVDLPSLLFIDSRMRRVTVRWLANTIDKYDDRCVAVAECMHRWRPISAKHLRRRKATNQASDAAYLGPTITYYRDGSVREVIGRRQWPNGRWPSGRTVSMSLRSVSLPRLRPRKSSRPGHWHAQSDNDLFCTRAAVYGGGACLR